MLAITGASQGTVGLGRAGAAVVVTGADGPRGTDRTLRTGCATGPAVPSVTLGDRSRPGAIVSTGVP